MESIEVKAKTVHEAIENACEQLGANQEDLDIEILEQGGVFKKACIRATKKGGAASAAAPVKSKRVTPPPPQKTSTSNSDVPKFTKTHTFVTKLIELLDNGSTITTETTDNAFNINVDGENIGQLIGKNGMVLNALQTLVSSIAISNSNGESRRVYINIGDYRERRGNSIQELALKKAESVKSSGRQVKLDPMNARERAIIHSALQGIQGIKTYSTGKEPFRCLCIAPAD